MLGIEVAQLTRGSSCTSVGALGSVECFVKSALLSGPVGQLLGTLLLELGLRSGKGCFQGTDASLGSHEGLGVTHHVGALEDRKSVV